MTNRQYFLQAVKFLDGTAGFTDILLQGKIMKAAKKESFWSVVTFRGYKGDRFYGGIATIYVNLRDLRTREQILEAIDQEANHIKPAYAGYYADQVRQYMASVGEGT